MSGPWSVSSLDEDELPLSSSLSVPSEFSDSAMSDPIPELELDSEASDDNEETQRGGGLWLWLWLLLVVVVVLPLHLVGDTSFVITGSESPASSVLVTRPYPIATSTSSRIGNSTSNELIIDVVFGRRR